MFHVRINSNLKKLLVIFIIIFLLPDIHCAYALHDDKEYNIREINISEYKGYIDGNLIAYDIVGGTCKATLNGISIDKYIKPFKPSMDICKFTIPPEETQSFGINTRRTSSIKFTYFPPNCDEESCAESLEEDFFHRPTPETNKKVYFIDVGHNLVSSLDDGVGADIRINEGARKLPIKCKVVVNGIDANPRKPLQDLYKDKFVIVNSKGSCGFSTVGPEDLHQFKIYEMGTYQIRFDLSIDGCSNEDCQDSINYNIFVAGRDSKYPDRIPYSYNPVTPFIKIFHQFELIQEDLFYDADKTGNNLVYKVAITVRKALQKLNLSVEYGSIKSATCRCVQGVSITNSILRSAIKQLNSNQCKDVGTNSKLCIPSDITEKYVPVLEDLSNAINDEFIDGTPHCGNPENPPTCN